MIKPLISLYHWVTFLWLTIFVAFYGHTYIKNKDHALPLQKVIMLIPFIKIIETMSEGSYV